jgi:hypothetical protein
MKRKSIRLFAALASASLMAGGAYAQKPTLSTNEPVKSQVRLKTDPLKADAKLPGTAKVTVKGKKPK